MVSTGWVVEHGKDANVRVVEVDVDTKASVIAYCRIGERSSHSWFVLSYLLGYKNVLNYDGSWTEWGGGRTRGARRGRGEGVV